MTKQFSTLMLLGLLLVSILSGSGCAPSIVTDTKLNMYPDMYSERPMTILVLPPVNQTTSPEAKEYFECTLLQPIAEVGYYVLPIEVTNEILKSEGVYDSEILDESALPKFESLFGADAVLWTTITEWDKSYKVLAGNVVVSVIYKLQSTKTQEILWNYSGTLKIDTSGNSNSGSGGGLAGLFAKLVVDAVATAVKTKTQDQLPIARQVNVKVLQTLPVGSYHPLFNLDKEDKIVVQSPPATQEAPNSKSPQSELR